MTRERSYRRRELSYIEEWRTCAGCSKYEVSNYSQVRNRKTKNIINPYPSVRDGVRIRLETDDGERISFPLDVVVARAFYGECPPNHILVHLDDNRFNCRADNLEWMSRAKAPLPKHISYQSRIRCVENGKEYDSLYECSEDLDISLQYIIKSLRNSRIGIGYRYKFELLD